MNNVFSTYSVIPTEIMISKDISSTTKLLYGLISSLTNEKGYCWASNAYLGEILGKSDRQIGHNINCLLKLRLINCDIKANFKRKITLTGTLPRKKTSRGVEENFLGGGRKLPHNNIIEKDKSNILLADAKISKPLKGMEKPKGKYISFSALYENMAMPKKVRAVNKWQDEAANAYQYFTDGEEKRASIFKCYKDNQHYARIAFSDCKELGKRSALYFLKVYNELKKRKSSG